MRADLASVQNRQTAGMPPSASVPAFPALCFPSDSSSAVFFFTTEVYRTMPKTFNTWNKKKSPKKNLCYELTPRSGRGGCILQRRSKTKAYLPTSPHPLNSFHTFIKARLTGRRDERRGQTLTVILHPGSRNLKFSSRRASTKRLSIN